jgi:hypothetical protein
VFKPSKRRADRVAAARELVVAAIRSCAIISLADPDSRAALDDPGGDCALEALGFDSLSRLELATHLDAIAGIQLSEEDVHRAGTVAGLTSLAAARL